MLEDKVLTLIGAGKLGEALVLGLLKNSGLAKDDIRATVGREESVKRAIEKLDVATGLDNKAAVDGADIIILAVKPQKMDSILTQIAPVLKPEQLIISVAASVSTSFIQQRLKGDNPVIRAMPNTPSIMNAGMTALCGGEHAKDIHLAQAEKIFKCVGETVFLDESLMDGVTALSASGPAYLYVVIESLAEAGVKLGIPRDTSTLLAAQTMYGAAKMVLESKAHPALLKDMVTTPAGCTIDGLMELEEGKLRVTLIKAVVTAAKRASELVES